MIYPPKLHSDDANRCLHYKSGSRVVPDLINLVIIVFKFNFVRVYVSPGQLEQSSYDLEKCFW